MKQCAPGHGHSNVSFTKINHRFGAGTPNPWKAVLILNVISVLFSEFRIYLILFLGVLLNTQKMNCWAFTQGKTPTYQQHRTTAPVPPPWNTEPYSGMRSSVGESRGPRPRSQTAVRPWASHPTPAPHLQTDCYTHHILIEHGCVK